MPADEEPRGEIGENDDAEHDVERFRDVVGRQKRRRNDEQDGYDIERQPPVAKTDALGRRALVEAASAPSYGGERHGGIFTARAHYCKRWVAVMMKTKDLEACAGPRVI